MPGFFTAKKRKRCAYHEINQTLIPEKETGFDDNKVLLYEGDVSDEETVKRFVEEDV